MDWHARYLQQAGWTGGIRQYLYNKAGLAQARRVLDVGCGTGALLLDLPLHTSAQAHGLDLNREHLAEARRHAAQAHYTQADAAHLPYPDGCFEAVFCHFVLLWVRSPLQVLQEMKRITRPGGALLALAEPDYGGRIDYPSELAQVGAWQAQSLRAQSADPEIGRKLRGLFAAAGLERVETGLLGGQWSSDMQAADVLEWQVLEDDLRFLPQPPAPGEVQRLRRLEQDALRRGERLLFVPTFYAIGFV